ncbi:hypothetical protein ACT453_57980, partial [Bacillus sp. D-CC]
CTSAERAASSAVITNPFCKPKVSKPESDLALNRKPCISRVDAEFGFLTANSKNGLVITAEEAARSALVLSTVPPLKLK